MVLSVALLPLTCFSNVPNSGLVKHILRRMPQYTRQEAEAILQSLVAMARHEAGVARTEAYVRTILEPCRFCGAVGHV